MVWEMRPYLCAVNFLKETEVAAFFELSSASTLFVYPIVSDTKCHWTSAKVLGFYIRRLSDRQEFFINYGHYDSAKISLPISFDFIKDSDIVYKIKYVRRGLDLDILNWIGNGIKINSFDHTSITPIYKIFEHCRDVFDIAEKLAGNINPLTANGYNDFILNLIQIEANGFYTQNGIEYTEYNPFTVTGRPSNSFGGINYAALKKNEEGRGRFMSRYTNGFLVEFDYHAYHIHLIAKLINYTFKNPANVYGDFADIMGVEPEQAKVAAFRYLYGGSSEGLMGVDFFQKVDSILSRFDVPEIESFMFKKKMETKKNFRHTLNYFIQNLETEINSRILRNINGMLAGKKTKIVLYTYDSFLFDFNPDDSMALLKDLKNNFEQYGMPVKIKAGLRYDKMSEKHI